MIVVIILSIAASTLMIAGVLLYAYFNKPLFKFGHYGSSSPGSYSDGAEGSDMSNLQPKY